CAVPRELAGVLRMLAAVPGCRAVTWLLHLSYGQEPAWGVSDGNAGHVPAHVPALRLRLSDRSNAGHRPVDHADIAGALLRFHRAKRVSQGHTGRSDGGRS